MNRKELFEIGTSPKNDGGVYITTTFKWKAPNNHVDLHFPREQFHQDIEAANKYMDAVISCIKIFKKIIKNKGHKYDPMHIAAAQLTNIEAWTCPITVLSKLSIEDAAERLYEGFDNRFKKDTAEIEALIKKRETDFYSLNYREEERLFELNKKLNYGLSEELLKSKSVKLLDEMQVSADKALELLRDLNKKDEGTN